MGWYFHNIKVQCALIGKFLFRAILPNSPNATTLPISLSGVAYDYLIRHSNAEFPNVTENPILSEAKKIKNHTLPKPNDNKNISGMA